jgi:hypothetical protein
MNYMCEKYLFAEFSKKDGLKKFETVKPKVLYTIF